MQKQESPGQRSIITHLRPLLDEPSYSVFIGHFRVFHLKEFTGTVILFFPMGIIVLCWQGIGGVPPLGIRGFIMAPDLRLIMGLIMDLRETSGTTSGRCDPQPAARFPGAHRVNTHHPRKPAARPHLRPGYGDRRMVTHYPHFRTLSEFRGIFKNISAFLRCQCGFGLQNPCGGNQPP